MSAAAPSPAFDNGAPALGDHAFREFQRLALDLTGIQLSENQRPMIAGRFAKRLRALSLGGYEDYLALVREPEHAERGNFIDTVTTNLTYFFREPHHFAYLRDEILAGRRATRASSLRPLRLWSAGCSAGQEPYSMAMLMRESAPSVPARILASDIDNHVLARARAGIYSGEEMRGLDDARRARWFSGTAEGRWSVDPSLQASVLFRPLNLFAPWPIRPGVDVIFCRNVLIYFDAVHQRRLIASFARVQGPGDHLFIGHSENLADEGNCYERVANTVYRRR